MTALAFVLTGPDPAAVMDAAHAGDEVILAPPTPAAAALAAFRRGVAGRPVAWFGTQDPDGPPPPGTVALRPLGLGAACPPGAIANLALARAGAAGVVWLPAGGAVDPAQTGGMRQELTRGTEVVFGAGGMMAISRDLLHRAVLPLPETAPGIEGAAFFWRALIAARRIAGPVPPVPPAAQFGPPPDPAPPGAIFSLIEPLLETITAAGGDAVARADACGWLLERVARHLADLPPGEFWSYAEAASPFAARRADLLHSNPAPAAQALAHLARAPLWQVVAAWQGARLAGRLPGRPDAPDIARAQALWRRMRETG